MKFRLKHFLFLLPALVAAAIILILPHFPNIAEYIFSRGIFRAIATPLGWLVSVLPFSLTELAVVAAFPVCVALLVMLIIRMRRAAKRRQGVESPPAQAKTGRGNRRAVKPAHTPGQILARAGRGVGWALSSALLMYMLMHGANFDRQPVSQLMNLPTATSTPQQLEAICIDLADRASAARAALEEDSEGRMKFSQSTGATLRQANEGYRALGSKYPFLWGAAWRAKPVVLSHLWSYTGITGMYDPLLAEANVNVDQPDCDIPFTAAHELAHTRGFAREEEANFFAYLTCINNSSADARYSGLLNAYEYCYGALHQYDPALADAAAAHCSDAMNRDMAGQGAYWAQFSGGVQQAAANINNAFISSQNVGGNGVAAGTGTLSYDGVVRLIVGYYEVYGGM